MSETGKDAKSIALQMEMDGVKFYSDLANKTIHPVGKAMFKSFIEDERQHIKRIQTLMSAEEKESASTKKEIAEGPKERLVTIFQSMGEKLKNKIDPNANDIDAVKLAMKMEKEGMEFYEKAAKESDDEIEREYFHFLAEEENIHFKILENTLDYLENQEKWEAEKEGRIYDVWINMINKTL